MLNTKFKGKLLNEAFSCDVPKGKKEKATELYLDGNIEAKEKSSTSISFKIKGLNIEIKSDIGISYILNNKKSIKDEYYLACILDFKRKNIVDNEKPFNDEDIYIKNHYYNDKFVTFFNEADYKLRLSFYIGVIDELFALDMKEQCINYIVNMFYLLEEKLSFEARYQDDKYLLKYKVIKNKQEMLINNIESIIFAFDKLTPSTRVLMDFIYTITLNFPNTLRNPNIHKVYDFLDKKTNKYEKEGQLYKSMIVQKNLVKWLNGADNLEYIINNIDKYEVRYCFVKEMYANEKYDTIYNIMKKTKFAITNYEINHMITSCFYMKEDYEGAIGIFNRFNNITYDIYLSYKNDFPILFEEQNVDKIITNIIQKNSNDILQQILIGENLNKYQIFVLAHQDFDLLDSRFGDFLGKYDDQLLKIYQKEIVRLAETLKWRYNEIPNEILKKLEKLKRINNGKYYILETIEYIKSKKYLSYSRELDKYLGKLGI